LIPQSQREKFPVTDIFSHIEVADGRIWLKPALSDGAGRTLVAPGTPRPPGKSPFQPLSELSGHWGVRRFKFQNEFVYVAQKARCRTTTQLIKFGKG